MFDKNTEALTKGRQPLHSRNPFKNISVERNKIIILKSLPTSPNMEGCISAEIEFAITGADCNLLAVNHLSRPSLYYAPLFRGRK